MPNYMKEENIRSFDFYFFLFFNLWETGVARFSVV